MIIVTVEIRISEILRKRVDQLTEEEKKILRKWYLSHYGRGAKIDIHRTARHIPVYVKTWYKHPNRYDIPGVDTPKQSNVYNINKEKQAISEILQLYNPPYNYPPSHIREKAKQIIDKILSKYGLNKYEVFEYMGERIFPIDRLYSFIIEAWTRGWDPEEIIKELKPIARSYKEYITNVRNKILDTIARDVIRKYVNKLIEWIKKNGKKSGWKIIKVNYYSTTGGYDIKLLKYDPIYKNNEYYVYIILRPFNINNKKSIVMDIMFSKNPNEFSNEYSIQYIYEPPTKLEKESIFKILSGAFLGHYLIKNQKLNITNNDEAFKLLKKENVMF